jgi:hypothetical protein
MEEIKILVYFFSALKFGFFQDEVTLCEGPQEISSKHTASIPTKFFWRFFMALIFTL